MKIRTRLTIYFTLLVTALIVVISVVIYTSINKFSRERFFTRLNDKSITKAIWFYNIEDLDSTLLKAIDRSRNDVMVGENIAIYDTAGQLVYSSNDKIRVNPAVDLFERLKKEQIVRYEQDSFRVSALFYQDGKHSVFVVAAAIDRYGEILLETILNILLFTIFGSMLVTAFMGWFFVGESLKPISAIVEQVREIQPLRKSERLPALTENDEIAALVSTFNKLFDNLEDAFKAEKSFVANVSHELNNPLTKLKSQIDVALFQNRDNEFYRGTLKSVQEDLEELSALIRDLLEFSRISNNQFIADKPVRLDEVLFDSRSAILETFPAYKVSIDFMNPPEDENKLIIKGNRKLLITAFKNIIENACKYSGDGTAQVTLRSQDGSLLVSVSDKGPGIAEEDIPHVFELFYRAASPESVKGFGIGLALANRILSAHGVQLKVDSEKGKGTIFTTIFFIKK